MAPSVGFEPAMDFRLPPGPRPGVLPNYTTSRYVKLMVDSLRIELRYLVLQTSAQTTYANCPYMVSPKGIEPFYSGLRPEPNPSQAKATSV